MKVNPENYSAIIFDLGGVLLNIDYNAPAREFAKLGITDFATFYSKMKQSDLFDQFETGMISPQQFREAIKSHSLVSMEDQQIDDAWNSLLLDFPSDRIQLLQQLKHKLPLFLLSNTNEIHIHAFENLLITRFGKNVFDDLFVRYYYSSRMKARKPDTACFLQVIHDNHLNPSTTLFIDDSPQHVEGARKAGLQAVHLTGELTDLFR